MKKQRLLFEITQVAYNPNMPTPFYHLSIAQTLLDQKAFSPGVQEILERRRGAFLFGNTAADVQVLSGQARQITHFFKLPLHNNSIAPWELMLRTFPSLDDCRLCAETQAAFVAGYQCHLMADWLWIGTIFVPAFGKQAEWSIFPHRLYLHNVLRAYLDRQILPGLVDETSKTLEKVAPEQWLPFVNDRFLCAWRDYLAEQLQPGATVHTVEVLARRQGMTPEEYMMLLDSEERMDDEIFIHLPREKLTRYRQETEDACIALVDNYFIKN
ncbi:MAG: hypothetical protein JW908_06575 [Anaerolineales bacterium]|nr:hypothetical protein [Anaerolineales bacterium]